jgi:hypothetical protein
MSDDQETIAGESPEPSATQKLRLTRPHLLIQRTLDLKVEKDPWGHVRQPTWPGVDVQVSKALKRNALIVLDRLFKSLEKSGIEISVSSGGYGENGTFAVRNHADKVRVCVIEEYKKVPHVPTAKELKEQERPFPSRIPKFDSVSTGKLTLQPGGVVDLSSEDAVALLVKKATDDILAELEAKRQEREKADAARRLEWQRQKEEQEEKGRISALHKAADSLRQYREIMAYIEEVRRFGRVPDDQRKEGQTLDEWLRWAEWRARQVHPIR